MTHAQVENVASRVRDGMEYLFDPDKPYFEAWVQLHNVDCGTLPSNAPNPEPGARPLYYVALYGFHELVEHLTLEYPQCASATGGSLGTALHSASYEGHLQIVRSLLRHGVGVDVRGHVSDTPLQLASSRGHRDVVQCLLEHGADVDLQDDYHNTPLTLAAHSGHIDVVRVLLEHNADVNSRDLDGQTPLHDAIWGNISKGDYPRVVRLLLEHGANTSARDTNHQTPLHLVSMRPSKLDIARILLEHGADVDAEDKRGRTPLQVALEEGCGEMARLLSEFRSGRAQT